MDITSIVKDNFVSFEHTASLSEVIGKLKELEKQAALIFKNDKLLGMIEKRKVLRSNINLHETHVENFLEHVSIIEESTDLMQAISLFASSNSMFLPVVSDKQITGIVSAVDLAKLAMDLPETGKLAVQDIKYAKPAKLNLTDNLGTALEVMRTENIEVLPVFSQGKLHGVVGYKDIIRKLLGWSPKKDVSGKFNADMRSRSASVDIEHGTESKIENFVTEEVITIAGKSTLQEALEQLQNRKYSSLIVSDNDSYKGILTVRNILNTIAKIHKIDNFSIYFVGVNKINLTEHQRKVLDAITYREAQKLQRRSDSPFSIAVHLKQINKDGKKGLFQINLKIDIDGQFHSCAKEDWDLETALHKCFNMVKAK